MRKGNLLEEIDKGTTIAHCIATDMRMGAGIANKIRIKCNTKAQYGHRVGDIAVQKTRQGGYIFHMMTKKHSPSLPSWQDFTKTIGKLPKLCERLNIKELSIPKIGAGLDAFDWHKVMAKLKKIFQHCDTKVTVMHLDKDSEVSFRRTGPHSKQKIKTDHRVKLDIIGDSHTRDWGSLLPDKDRNKFDIHVETMPGKSTEQISEELNKKTAHMTPSDHTVFMSGTNDIKQDVLTKGVTIQNNLNARRNMLTQARHTNVIICSVPYRYDNPALNTYIDIYNNQLYDTCKSEAIKLGIEDRVKFLNINRIIKKDDYNQQGLHLKIEGKKKILSCIMAAIAADAPSKSFHHN